MDIFRSKEVYRKVRKRDDVNTQDPIIPVRGMYVVGQYLVPEYKGSGIEITGIRTTHPKIVNFTEGSSETYDVSSIGLYSHTLDLSSMVITKYSKSDKPAYDPSSVGLYSHTFGNISYLKYTRSYDHAYDPSSVGLYYHTLLDNHTVVDYYPRKMKSTPEPMIVIRNVQTHAITITDN